MSWNDIALELIRVLLPIVATALVTLIGYGIVYLKKQAQKIDNDITQQVLLGALNEAEKVANDAVHATNQRLVDDLKAKAADGKLTSQEMSQAMSEAQKYFMTHISVGSMNVLKATIGPIEKWLESYLDAKLGEQKSGQIQARVYKIANPT